MSAIAGVVMLGYAQNRVLLWAIPHWPQLRFHSGIVNWLLCTSMLGPGAAALILTPRRGRAKSLGLTVIPTWGTLAIALAAPVAFRVVANLLQRVVAAVPPLSAELWFVAQGPLSVRVLGSCGLWAVSLLLYWGPFALGEELFWRGLLWRQLAGRPFRPWTATWLIGLAWASWHFAFDRNSALFLLPQCVVEAIALSYLRLSSGSLWPCVMFHAAIDNQFTDFQPQDPGRWLEACLISEVVCLAMAAPFAVGLWKEAKRVRRLADHQPEE